MDALDFGIHHDVYHRGLSVTEGLGFFRAGIVDPHFSGQRGRLGRLARALIEEHVRFGFGIDENTAMLVSHDGRIEVVGTGNLTIVDTANARCNDGPLGCRISGVRLSCLQTVDCFDPVIGAATARPEKRPIEEGSQYFNGNHLIADIAGPGAVPWAIFSGLAENSSRKQEGITLRYNRGFGHRYRFKFAKTEQNRRIWGLRRPSLLQRN
jgi:cyanophycinase